MHKANITILKGEQRNGKKDLDQNKTGSRSQCGKPWILNFHVWCLGYILGCGLLRLEYLQTYSYICSPHGHSWSDCTLPAAFCSRLSTLLSSIVPRFPSFEALAFILGSAFRDSVYTIDCSLLQILVSVWLKASSCMHAVPKYIATLTFLYLGCVIAFKFGHLKRVRTKLIWILLWITELPII